MIDPSLIIYWLNDKVFVFDRPGRISSYSLDSTIDNIKRNEPAFESSLGMSPNRQKIYGYKDNWIYFSYELINTEIKNFKVNTELSKCVEVESIPEDIIK